MRVTYIGNLKKNNNLSTYLWVYFCLFLLFPPFGAMDFLFGSDSLLHFYMGALAFVLIIIKFFINRNKFPQYLKWYIGYFAICLFSTINHSPYFYSAIYFCGKMICFCLLFQAETSKYSLLFVKSIRNYFAFMFVVSFYFVIHDQGFFGLTASGNYTNFFINDNQQIFAMLACLSCCIYVDYSENKKLRFRTLLLLAVFITSIFKAWVGTAIPIFVVVAMFLLLERSFKISRLLKPKHLAIGIVILFFVLVFQWYDIPPVRYLVVDILHKRMDLSSRTYIWQSSWGYIFNSPFIGYGTGLSGVLHGFVNTYNETTGRSISYATHNFILEVIMQVGFVGMGLYAIFITKIIGQKKSTTSYNQLQYNTIAFITFCMFFMMLTSYFIYNPEVYLPLLLLNLIKSENSDKLKINIGRQSCLLIPVKKHE